MRDPPSFHLILCSWRNAMKLNRYWIEFEAELDGSYPMGTRAGCGVTALSYNEALDLIRERIFRGSQLPPIRRSS